MDTNLKTVVENSKREAEKLVRLTAEVRKAYALGRPNSSKESTAEGALEAFSFIISTFDPTGYTSQR